MQQGGDYSSSSSSYYQYHHPPQLQNPTPTDATYASAPPFAPSYSSSSSSDYSNFPSPYSHNPDPNHHHQLDPSYAPPNPNYQPYNPSPPPPPAPPLPSYSAPPDPYSSLPPPQLSPPYYPPSSYDHHQPPSNYATIPTTPNPNPNPNSSFLSSSYPASYSNPNLASSYSNPNLASSMPIPPLYESPSLNFDKMGAYLDQIAPKYGVQSSYNPTRSDPPLDLYDNPTQTTAFHSPAILDDAPRHNIYASQGGKLEPYGARGTGSKSSNFEPAFDDYGRSLSTSAKNQPTSNKVMKAVPKMDTQQDVKNGVQKFRVKLLAETGGQTPMDVLCQIGLDGIRMLDPNTSRTLRIYPLETITRSEVLDSSIFAFWSKSTVDVEPRRIRLKSSSYTTNTILDTVTAATFQLKEIGGKDSYSSRQSDTSKQSEQSTEKKKGFTDWVNLIKPGNEEKDHWVPDEAVTKCTDCATDFGAFVRRHHCRNCGDIFCDKCTHGRIALTADEDAQPVRVCDRCLAEVTQRLSNAKETASKPAVLCSHEDLAKKLQEEMDKNRKSSSGSKPSEGSGRRMKEVACPTCTVHLQVQVPSSGSETIECGVCQHPFLVSAH